MIRQPIVTLVGHVDHGKSSILDFIRQTSIVAQEEGGITQKISSANLPLSQIKKICGALLEKLNIKLTIPGILFIDTPGHAAFNNLRKRGGNLADIAILVIDVKEGVMPQTLESIDILRSYRTPFIVALNKIDSLHGWRENKEVPLIQNIQAQSEHTIKALETRLYDVVGKLSELGLNVERFDRVDDFTKQISIVPCSAKTGEGIPELLMVLSGLAQRYLEDSLKIEIKGHAKGTILEVREERGVGRILDVIIYDGNLKNGDVIGIATLSEPIFTKVRAIFEEERGKLKSKKEVYAASAVLLSAHGLDGVMAGMPLRVVYSNKEEVSKALQEEIEEVLIETDKEGVVVKADSLGSLEALTNMIKGKDIPIKRASIGEITKKDISEAKSDKDKLKRVILGFNVKPVHSTEIKIITHGIIYKIIEDYEEWIEKSTTEQRQKELENLIYPAKIQILRGAVFRQSHPAIVGVRVIDGKLRTNTILMKGDGMKIGEVKSMQNEGENVQEAVKNMEVAISLPKVTIGRQVDEETILYSDIPEQDFARLKKLKSFLKHEEIELLREIAMIKRKNEPLWGI